jgi:hypothetical protein
VFAGSDTSSGMIDEEHRKAIYFELVLSEANPQLWNLSKSIE